MFLATGPHKLGVKITSPSKNATVPAGQLQSMEFLQILPLTFLENFDSGKVYRMC